MRPNRRGLATLEFVMVLPVMMLFTVLILKCGEVTRAKINANLQARADVYTPPVGQEPTGLGIRALYAKLVLDVEGASFGMVEPKKSNTVPIQPVANKAFTLTGRVAVISGTWDHKGMKFRERDYMSIPLSIRSATLAIVPPEAAAGAAIVDNGAELLKTITGIDPSKNAGQLPGWDSAHSDGDGGPLKNLRTTVGKIPGLSKLLSFITELFNADLPNDF